jgi:enoyl-CoA hydratase
LDIEEKGEQMPAPVTYRLEDSIATITMDDGKVNALSLELLSEINRAFDRAAEDRAVVLLAGRPGVFSAGFDLGVLRAGGTQANDMVRAGFELAERMLAFPAPVVMECTGHALAMGMFLLLSGDYRVGAVADHKIGATEVALGITMPWFGVEICRQRLTPAYFNRAVISAEIFMAEEAVTGGFLDRVVPAEDLHAVAQAKAVELSKLDIETYAATKLRAREQSLKAIRAAIEADASGGRPAGHDHRPRPYRDLRT